MWRSSQRARGQRPSADRDSRQTSEGARCGVSRKRRQARVETDVGKEKTSPRARFNYFEHSELTLPLAGLRD